MAETSRAALPNNNPLWVYLFAANSTGVRAQLGEGSATVDGGLGGWESVPRPGRRPLTVWRGPEEPLRMGLPLVFDGYGRIADDSTVQTSVEAELRQLEIIAGVAVREDPVPPFITVLGAVPHDLRWAPRNRWVIEDLEWGAAERRFKDGQRVRQFVDVTLLLYTEPDRMRRLTEQSRPTRDPVKAKDGDTFEKIAARELGAGKLGAKLARLNGKRSPDKKLEQGELIKFPTLDALREWKQEA